MIHLKKLGNSLTFKVKRVKNYHKCNLYIFFVDDGA